MARKKIRKNSRLKLLTVLLIVIVLVITFISFQKPKEQRDAEAAYLPDDGVAAGVSRIRIGGTAYDCQGRPMENVYVAAIWNNQIRDEDTTDKTGAFHISSNINYNQFALVAGRDAKNYTEQTLMTRVQSPSFVGVRGQQLGCDKINCNYKGWNRATSNLWREHYHVGTNSIWTESYFRDFFVSTQGPTKGFDFRPADCPAIGLTIENPTNGQRINSSSGTQVKVTLSTTSASAKSDWVKVYYMPYNGKPIIDLNCQDTTNTWTEIKKLTRDGRSLTVNWKRETGQNFPTAPGKYLLAANASVGGKLCTGNPSYDPATGLNCANPYFANWCNVSGNREDPSMWKIVEIAN